MGRDDVVIGCSNCGYVLCNKCEEARYDAVDEEFDKDFEQFFIVCADADVEGHCKCGDTIHRGYRLHKIVIKGKDRVNKEITRCQSCGEEDCWGEINVYELIDACEHENKTSREKVE
jgi:hypothetical protein